MKITIYTVSDCPFSKQEKEYLTSHNLPFEEKNLETNKEFLTEMLTISNNFAGTPVTKIEKDDGEIIVLKGFTQEEFDKKLGLTPKEEAAVSPVAPSSAASPSQPPPASQPTTPSSPTGDTVSPSTSPASSAAASTPPSPPADSSPSTPPAQQTPPSQPDDSLQSILNDLKEKTENQNSSTTNPQNIPPSIPDFPDKGDN